MKNLLPSTFLALALLSPQLAFANPVVYSAGGTLSTSIDPTVTAFQTELGTLNPNTAGSVGTGRREINWDGVPDASSAPATFAADFFNTTSPRGAVFSTPGTGFQVSNTTAGNIRFENINSTYSTIFSTFSAQKLFSPIGSNVTTVNFFVPGATTAATTEGFGSVFLDVDKTSSVEVEYFDVNGTSLAKVSAPEGAFSFVGVLFNEGEKVSHVRITAGSVALGGNDDSTNDIVVMDDFIYGEPSAAKAIVPVIDSPIDGSATTDNTPTISGKGKPGASVDLSEGATLVGSSEVNASGIWSLTTLGLIDGTHAFTAAITENGTTKTSDATDFVIYDSRPTKPTLVRSGRRVAATLQPYVGTVTYIVTARSTARGRTRVVSKRSSTSPTTLNLSSGRWTISYVVRQSGITTKASPTSTIQVN